MNKEQLREIITRKFVSSKQVFGRGEFYQSFSMLDIRGQRPTDTRIKAYDLWEYVNKNMTVLDIGCNVGFFDMTIADKVQSVLGIEYNKELVDIATLTARELAIDNVRFIAEDFNWWKLRVEDSFDIIFSFAVHYWLKVTPEDYCRSLCNMLNTGGYVFFESQNIRTVDREFEEYRDEFVKNGLMIVKEGYIKDDGIIERKFYVLKKL